MTFIVTLIALLIERFFDWSHLRHWAWYEAFKRAVDQRLTGKSAYLLLAVDVVPLLIVVMILQVVLNGVLYGLAELIFELVIFLYCLGPQNLWADSFACLNALMQGDTQFALDKLKTSFNLVDVNPANAHRKLLDTIFIAANTRIFGVLFWYVLLGPVGAVLYRSVILTAQTAAPDVAQKALRAEEILNWLPVRAFTFIFALGGQFVEVLSIWRKKVLAGLRSNEDMLTDCGRAAIGCEDKTPEDGSAETKALSLLDRALVIALVLVAIVVLIM